MTSRRLTKKFIVLYHSPQTALDKMEDASPEEMKKGMEPWMEWAKKCGDKLLDMGAPLGNGQKIKKDGSSTSDSDLNGFSILQAKDMDEAVSLLQGHPHLDWAHGCSIEVFEELPMPGM